MEILAKYTEFEIESLQLSLNLLHQCESILQDEFNKIEAQNILFFSDGSLRDGSEPNGAVQIDGLINQSCLLVGLYIISYKLIRNLIGCRIKWSLRVVMVQGDSQSQTSHLLFELVEDAEISIDTIVLGYQLQQWHSDKSKDDIITLIENLFVMDGVLRAFFVIQESCVKVSSSRGSAALSQLLQFLLV